MIESMGGGYAVELWLSEDYSGVQGDVERELAAAMESAQARGRTALTVEVHEGVAILAGTVRAWAEKVAARAAVMHVRGVTTVDDRNVEVIPDAAEARSDIELAGAARIALDWNSRVPHGAVHVAVAGGRVTLSGTVGHEDQRAAAVDAVAPLVAVRELVNDIAVPPRAWRPDSTAQCDEALARALGRDAKHVQVRRGDTAAELTGRLPSLALRGEAERAVRRVLGDVPLVVKLH
jgi:osmotically-inducible protein OsmY